MPERAKTSAPMGWLLFTGVLAVAMQIPKSLPLALGGLLLLLGFFLVTDRGVLRSIGNPRFWIVGLLISGVSGLVLGKRHIDVYGLPLSVDGLETGLLIVVRAAIFISFLMALSRRMSADFLVRAFSRLGMPQLGAGFALAVKLLPRMLDIWTSGLREGQSGISDRILRMLAGAADLADEIARDTGAWMAPRRNAMPFVVTGPKGSGKSHFLLMLAERLQDEGLRAEGFIQPSVFEGEKRLGYDLLFLPEGRRRVLARAADAPGVSVRWRFDESVFEEARRHLENVTDRDTTLVDEIGVLERQGGGHWPALARVLPSRGGVWVLSIRRGLEETMVSRLGYVNARILRLPSDEDAREAFLLDILQSARSEREKRETPRPG